MRRFGSGRDEEAARRAEESLRSIERGGLPLAAQERLDALRGRRDGFFTSDLSVNEFLVSREAGFRPLTQVMGSCFYHVGYQWLPGWQSAGVSPGPGGAMAYGAGRAVGETFELETQTEAWNEARRLALGRLAEEATRAGADAVVGVRLERGAYDWAAGLIEFVVAGTAVVSERYELAGEAPLLSNLSGQELAGIVRHGWWPAGLVAGSTVCYVVSGWAQQSRAGAGIFSSWQNQELPDFTRGMYDARAQAMRHVARQGHELGAHGVIGVQLQRELHELERDVNGVKYTDLVVTMHVLGTAVVELARRGEDPPVYVALPLS